MNRISSISITLIVLASLGASLFSPVFMKRAEAADLGSLATSGYDCLSLVFGGDLSSQAITRVSGYLDVTKIQVKDGDIYSAATTAACKTFTDKLLERAERIAMYILKRRILNAIVDQTIAWIEDGTRPKYIDNFDKFVTDQTDKAIGDVAQGLGLGQLCDPRLGLQLGLGLARRSFPEQVSCTLTRIIDNVNAFRNDFESGSWAGYHEVLLPQNNRWGIEIIAASEQEKKEYEQDRIAQLQASAGGGFLGTQECLEWKFYAPNAKGQMELKETVSPGGSDASRDPNVTPVTAISSANPNGYWKCTQPRVSTPGQILLGATQKAVNAQTEYTITADDLTDYAAAMIDAGINRLVKEGVKGLRGVIQNSRTSDSNGVVDASGHATAFDASNTANLGADYRTKKEAATVGSSQLSLVDRMKAASSTIDQGLTDAQSVMTLNPSIVTKLNEFKSWCTSGGSTLHPTTCATYGTDAPATARLNLIPTINGYISDLQGYKPVWANLKSQIDGAGEANLGAVSQQANTFINTVTAKANEVNQLLTSSQTELSTAASLIAACQSVTPAAQCP